MQRHHADSERQMGWMDGGKEGGNGGVEWGAVTKLCRWHANRQERRTPLGNASTRTRHQQASTYRPPVRSLGGNKFIRCMKKTQ